MDERYDEDVITFVSQVDCDEIYACALPTEMMKWKTGGAAEQAVTTCNG